MVSLGKALAAIANGILNPVLLASGTNLVLLGYIPVKADHICACLPQGLQVNVWTNINRAFTAEGGHRSSPPFNGSVPMTQIKMLWRSAWD